MAFGDPLKPLDDSAVPLVDAAKSAIAREREKAFMVLLAMLALVLTDKRSR